MPGRFASGRVYPSPHRIDPWARAAPLPYPWAPPLQGPPRFAPPPVAPRGTSPRTWALLSVAVVLVVLAALAGLIASVGRSERSAKAETYGPSGPGTSKPSATVTPPPAPIVPAEDLSTLLLDAGAINRIMGTRELAVNPTLTTTRLYIDTTDKPECGGVWANANKGVYAGSGWVSVQTQYLREPTDTSHEVFQSVISFPTAAAAADFAAKEAKNWPLCNGTSIKTTTPNNPSQNWWVAAVSERDGMLTSVVNREGARGWGCQHALTAKNNVVVDVEACGFSIQQQGTELARKVAAGIR